jgi:hypothetical protein
MQWEYKFVELKPGDNLELDMNKLGADGWEIFSMQGMAKVSMIANQPTAVWICVCKRPKKQGATNG